MHWSFPYRRISLFPAFPTTLSILTFCDFGFGPFFQACTGKCNQTCPHITVLLTTFMMVCLRVYTTPERRGSCSVMFLGFLGCSQLAYSHSLDALSPEFSHVSKLLPILCSTVLLCYGDVYILL